MPAYDDDGFEMVASGTDSRAIPILLYIKGRWVLGVERTELALGTKALVLSLSAGWIRLSKGEAPIRIAQKADQPLPLREALGDLDQRLWPLFDGKPSDPWARDCSAWLAFYASGRHAVFETRSVTGRNAVQDLADAVSWERRIRGVAVKPIIALESAVWQSSRGPIAIPKLAIIDWSDVTGGGSLPSGNTPPPAIDNKPPEPSATQAALRQHLGNAPKSPIPQPRRRQRNQATEKAEPTLSLRDDLDDDIPY